MPVGGELLAAGAYTVTWNSVALGLFEGSEGAPVLEGPDAKGEAIDDTNIYGRTTIDAVHLGNDYFAAMTCLEWRAGVIAAFHPYSATPGRLGIISRLHWDMASPLVFTVVTGTPSATTGPTTLTASKAFPAIGFSSRARFAPNLRRVPLRFQLYPFLDGASNIVHYTLTNP
jgi:hypothetical protein